MSEKEAALLALVPIKPFTAKTAARAWKMGLVEAQNALDALASRALLIDAQGRKNRYYVLPPPMAGFLRVLHDAAARGRRSEAPGRALLSVHHGRGGLHQGPVHPGRNPASAGSSSTSRSFRTENALHVLDYERASEVIKTASHRGIGLCYCRHKMGHAGRACDAPLDICMTFNTTAGSLIRHGYARAVDVAEGLALLDEARERNSSSSGRTSATGLASSATAAAVVARP